MENNLIANKRHDWRDLLRQVHISSAVWTMFYMSGLCIGATTVTIPQLQKEGHNMDDELISWLYSASNIAAIPWVLILPSLTLHTGRKLTYILTCVCTSTVHMILYFSSTPYGILAAAVIQGFANASNVTVMPLILMEYTTMKYREVFMIITTTNCYWGIWTSNAIGTYFYWKNIAILGIICSAYTFTIVFYPESPMWLAFKGKYEKAENAFKCLHGDTESKELIDAIKLHRINRGKNELKFRLFTIIKRKDFYKPILLVLAVLAQYYSSGKYIYSSYALEVISKMTNTKEAAQLGMLILDGVTILGMHFGSYLAKTMKRRTQFFSSAFLGVLFIFIISLYLYLVRLSILSENNVLTISLLVAYSLSISCGCMVLCLSWYCELIQFKYQRISYMIFALFIFVTCSVMLKFFPIAFKYLSIDLMFLFTGITCGIFSVILYVYLPETEGKSVLEIEELFKDKSESLYVKENKHLMNTP